MLLHPHPASGSPSRLLSCFTCCWVRRWCGYCFASLPGDLLTATRKRKVKQGGNQLSPLEIMAAGLALLALTAYTVLGGADFGGGVWDFFARGERADKQRQAIAQAMGPCVGS